uniref:Uncharacterized protein n=1 Tax=Amphimedon queenslandica TaxID=400682 RepID=A0A1X7SWN2_AMPQE
MCLATGVEISLKFHATSFIERNPELHNSYLELIEIGGSRHCVTYGINNRNPLIKLIGFDIIKCLPFDIMHTLFEGVASHHLQVLLEYLMKDKSFTMAQLNTILHTLKYNNSETKPSPINKDNDGSFHIKQTASQMLTLVRLFPLLCGDV